MTNVLLVIMVLLVAADVIISIYSRRVSNRMYYNLAEKVGKNRGDLMTFLVWYKEQRERINQIEDELRKVRNKK